MQRVADTLLQQQPDWTIVFRELLGVDGAAQRLFPTPREMERFTASPTYSEIQDKLATLRKSTPPRAETPNRVITVRLPASLHSALSQEAKNRGISLNQLCVSRLLEEEQQE